MRSNQLSYTPEAAQVISRLAPNALFGVLASVRQYSDRPGGQPHAGPPVARLYLHPFV